MMMMVMKTPVTTGGGGCQGGLEHAMANRTEVSEAGDR